MKFLCLLLCPCFMLAQSDTGVHSSKILRKYSTHDFNQSGFDIKSYKWDIDRVTNDLNGAEKQFRISKGLLGGAIASVGIGSGALITAALESKSRNSLTSTTTPFIITGVALNLVCMPICFVVREVIRKKATAHIQRAKSLMNIPE